MYQAIVNFFRPNLNKVLKQFDKAIADLEKVEADAVEQQRQSAATIAAAEAKAEAATNTAQRAANVKANLRTLIGE